ncbi:zinc metalloproteinase nas-37-like [Saccostrea cucullata]|uniref:zinc metalloproteinase nas-37-like n=1 Tax=Saccostrea cuccullata TaxID=36930 RepID=UPI002ED10357
MLLSQLRLLSSIVSLSGWSFWSDWTLCSYPCEGKTRWRKRHCMTQFCNGNYYEYEYCRPQDCLPETKPPPVAFRQNFNNSYLTKETKRYVKSTVRESLTLPQNNFLKKITRKNEKTTALFLNESNRNIDKHVTNMKRKIQEVTIQASRPEQNNMNAKQKFQPTSKEEGKGTEKTRCF